MNNKEYLNNLRHTAAHLLAAAVMQLWPDTKRTIGPSIEDGFYFDFEFCEPISETDLPAIEKKMHDITPTWKGFERHELTPTDAKKEYLENPYKHELIDEFAKEGQTLTFYKSGDYWDLCRGGHVENPAEELKHFKLLSVAGAYWRGNEKNKMLTRIYGTAFPTKEELDAHLEMLKEAKKRDHRKLGTELDLFIFSEMVGPGLPLWTPKGTLVRILLDDFVWTLRRQRGYEKVTIPHITKKELYETSGHWQKFSNELFHMTSREGHEFAMKPMNCPHHMQLYAHLPRSYRDLPQRYCETTICYRDEQTGELHGLSRLRSFTQDDAHVFCRRNQVKDESLKVWDIIDEFYRVFGFELSVRLSLHDPEHFERYLGTPELWQDAENSIRDIVKERGVEAIEARGEAAFYGPKIDFMAKDSIGRTWQVATIQLDINQPERFDLTCINEQGEKERIVMIHAAIMGSIERFLSILIEHYAGVFPVWLSPVQVAVLPVKTDYNDPAMKYAEELKLQGIRVSVDDAEETIGNKIRKASGEKIPYQLVFGDKEINSDDLMVRIRGQKDQKKLSRSEFLARIKDEIAKRA